MNPVSQEDDGTWRGGVAMENERHADTRLILEVADQAGSRSAGAATLVAARDASPHLTALEWQVVAAAFNDASGHSCGNARKPSRLASGLRRLLEALTGLRAPPRLADPRLEKLRFFLCFTRDKGRPSQQTWEELLELGFSEAQIEALALLALAGAWPRTRSSERDPGSVAASASHESSQRLT
jgi:hypothetical protein